jgi:hypothetical protein
MATCNAFISHVRWVACQHGMVRPQDADEGDGLQIWRVTANILNKQSQTVDKGWPSSLGLGVGLTTPHRKRNRLDTKDHKMPHTWKDSLDKRPQRMLSDRFYFTLNKRYSAFLYSI